jgi:hypothetical protein
MQFSKCQWIPVLILARVQTSGRQPVYDPEYTAPAHLTRLRARGLATKRSRPLRELELGIEALERFVCGEPLRRVHECVFGILALESEPMDPHLGGTAVGTPETCRS